MTKKHEARETSPRESEGLAVFGSRPRGRAPAPRSSTWLPLAVKIAIFAGGIAALAIIGATAGAHGPVSSDALALGASVPLPVSLPAAIDPPPALFSVPVHGSIAPSRA